MVPAYTFCSASVKEMPFAGATLKTCKKTLVFISKGSLVTKTALIDYLCFKIILL